MVEAEMGRGTGRSQCRAGSTKWVVVFSQLARYMVLGPCLRTPQVTSHPKVRKLSCCASTFRLLSSVPDVQITVAWANGRAPWVLTGIMFFYQALLRSLVTKVRGRSMYQNLTRPLVDRRCFGRQRGCGCRGLLQVTCRTFNT